MQTDRHREQASERDESGIIAFLSTQLDRQRIHDFLVYNNEEMKDKKRSKPNDELTVY